MFAYNICPAAAGGEAGNKCGAVSVTTKVNIKYRGKVFKLMVLSPLSTSVHDTGGDFTTGSFDISQ